MRSITALSLVAALAQPASVLAQGACQVPSNLVYPGRQWERVSSLEKEGWDTTALNAARQFSDSIGSHAVFVVSRGRVIAEWGATTEVSVVQSIRKSVLSALIGMALERGQLRLDATLGELGIDDTPPTLSALERTATVRHLLQSRSGISHPAAAAPSGTVPARGEHAPGEFWFYNNWDFNVLGTVYERATGNGIYSSIEELLAKPLSMESYSAANGQYQLEPISTHPAYHFSMSARDLARFGLLYLACGQWGGRQIVPSEWVRVSTMPFSEVTNPWTPKGALGYGFMWYVDHLFSGYSARGGTGQRVAVLPREGLVIVHRVRDDRPVFDAPIDDLIRRILAARR